MVIGEEIRKIEEKLSKERIITKDGIVYDGHLHIPVGLVVACGKKVKIKSVGDAKMIKEDALPDESQLETEEEIIYGIM